MKIHISSTFLLMALVIDLLGGCATIPEEHQGATASAGIGAATEGLAGDMLAGDDSSTKRALIGSLIGGRIGNYTVDKKRDAADTSNRYVYDSSAGILVGIESTSISPDRAYSGDRIDLIATYAVLAPQSNSEIAITESREIRFNRELVGKLEVSTAHISGTYDSNVPLFLANDAKHGIYQVITTIRTQDSSDAHQTFFTVR